MDIAVIGGGIAGLAAAWRLSRTGHRVTLFERHERPGFVASSVALEGEGGLRVDVPLRVFYPGYYPALGALYEELGVATEPVSYAASFTDAGGALFFRYRNLRLGARSWPWVAPGDLRERRARQIVGGALRFAAAARGAGRGRLDGLGLGEFLERGDYPQAFVDGLLLPALCTVATCSYAAAREVPAAVVAGYLAAGIARQSVRRAREGADDVARRLLGGVHALRCATAVAAVRRLEGGVAVRTAATGEERFDHVLLAAQANQSLALLADASAAERAVLAAFRCEPVEVAMHRDASLLPARRADWSAVNLRVDAAAPRPESTIWVNAVQPALGAAEPVFQTVNPLREPRGDRLIAQARFERPVVDAGSGRALAALARLHAEPGRRLWFCGSWAEAGIPLLESAVRSAQSAVRALNSA